MYFTYGFKRPKSFPLNRTPKLVILCIGLQHITFVYSFDFNAFRNVVW